MDTIYSKVIWDELGFENYQIHKEPTEKTEKLVIDWVKNSTKEKVDEVLLELGWLRSVTNEGYYDGRFYGFNQREKEARMVDGEAVADFMVHECGLESTFLQMAAKTRTSPHSLRFIADILEEYYKKINRSDYKEPEEGEEY